MAKPIDRTAFNALVDDDGTNLVGTVWNKEKIQSVILDPHDNAHRWTVVQSALAGDIVNYNEGIAGDTLIRCSNATQLQVLGIHPTAPAYPGQRVRFIAVGSAGVIFYHAFGGIPAGDGLILSGGVVTRSLVAGLYGSIEFQFDSIGQSWVQVGYDV